MSGMIVPARHQPPLPGGLEHRVIGLNGIAGGSLFRRADDGIYQFRRHSPGIGHIRQFRFRLGHREDDFVTVGGDRHGLRVKGLVSGGK